MLVTLTIGIILLVQLNRVAVVTIYREISQILFSGEENEDSEENEIKLPKKFGVNQRLVEETYVRDDGERGGEIEDDGERDGEIEDDGDKRDKELIPSDKSEFGQDFKEYNDEDDRPVIQSMSILVQSEKPVNLTLSQRIILGFLMTLGPSLTGLLVSDQFINFISTFAGLLTPIFLVMYPCWMVLKLHNEGRNNISLISRIGIWFYLIIGAGLSYIGLLINLI